MGRDDSLLVEYCGEVHEVRVEDSLTFGRSAELEIDTNPLLHRVLGHLMHGDGHWWIHNVGRSIPLRLADTESGATAVVPAGAFTALTARQTHVGFEAGQTHYELVLTTQAVAVAHEVLPAQSADLTVQQREVPLNADQRRLLAVLCESRLRDPAAPLLIPKNSEIQARLSWTRPQLNGKLDYLCARSAQSGVPGLRSTRGRATDRRRALAEWALRTRAVTAADLELVP